MTCSVEIIRLSDKTFKETIKDVELSVLRSTTKEGYISLDPSKPLPHEYEEGKMTRYNENAIYSRKYNVVDAESMATSMSSTANDKNGQFISLSPEYVTEVMPKTKYHSRIDDSEWNKHSLNSTEYEALLERYKENFDAIDVTDTISTYPNQTLDQATTFGDDNKLQITPNPVTRDAAPEVDKLLNGGEKSRIRGDTRLRVYVCV